jgi:hypothetical protein
MAVCAAASAIRCLARRARFLLFVSLDPGTDSGGSVVRPTSYPDTRWTGSLGVQSLNRATVYAELGRNVVDAEKVARDVWRCVMGCFGGHELLPVDSYVGEQRKSR